MGKKNGTFGPIFASVFITLIISGAGMYFGIPILYPNLNADLEEDHDENGGRLLQTQYLEVDTIDYIKDFNLTYTKMPGMELNITTSGNSSLHVTFEAHLFLIMDSDFYGFNGYNISLVVSGLGNTTTSVFYCIAVSLST